MKNYTILFLAVALFIVSACKHESVVPITLSVSDSCYADTVYFVNDIQPVLTANCAYSGCHDAQSHKEGVDLSSYEALMSDDELVNTQNPTNSELYDVMTSNGEKMMPPSGHLDQQTIDLFTQWMKQGARNNSCIGSCDTLNVSFSQDIMPIIESNCKSCHSGSSPSGGALLTTYAEIQGHASDGHLVKTITANGAPLMPPSGKLDDCKITLIKKWVNAGAPNN